MANSTFRTLSGNYADGILVKRNYIRNGNATNPNTANWSSYKNTAQASPVTGAGGSPAVTISTSPTSPLSGDNSIILSKGASNLQGEGWATDFSIDLQDRAKVLQVEFEYLVNSGTFAAGSTTTDSDVTVWLYDVTNSTLIQPTTFRLFANSTTLSTRFVSNFQTSATGSQYRLIMHVSTTSASAYSLKVDSISVSPSQYVYGTPITDWVDAGATTIGAVTTPPTKGTVTIDKLFWRRVGDSVHLRYQFEQTTAGTAGSGNYLFPLPAGMTIDTNKVNNIGNGSATIHLTNNLGWFGGRFGGGPDQYSGYMFAASTTQLAAYMQWQRENDSARGAAIVGSAIGALNAGAMIFNYEAFVPIAGWSSSVQTSDQADSRIISARVFKNGTQAFSTETKLTGFTVDFDRASLWDGTNNRFNIPVSGDYVLQAQSYATATSASQALAYRLNGGSSVYFGSELVSTAGGRLTANALIPNLRANDYIEIYQFCNASITVQAGNGNTFLSLQRLSQASLISATETVACRVIQSAQSNLNNTTETKIINLSVKIIDTHNSFDTTNNEYVIPVGGVYEVLGGISFGPNATGTRVGYISTVRSGVTDTFSAADRLGNPTAADQTMLKMTYMARFNAGDKIYLTGFQSSGGVLGTGTSLVSTFIQVKRVGI